MSRPLRGFVILALLFGACTRTIDDPSPTLSLATTTSAPLQTTTTVEALTTKEAIAEFEVCLADAGIGVEPIPFDAEGHPRFDLVMPEVDFGDSDQVKALAGCATIFSDGAIGVELGSEMQVLVVAALTEFAQCVRDHGVEEFPDPYDDFDGVGSPFPHDLVPFGDPGLETATRLCADRLGE